MAGARRGEEGPLTTAARRPQSLLVPATNYATTQVAGMVTAPFFKQSPISEKKRSRSSSPLIMKSIFWTGDEYHQAFTRVVKVQGYALKAKTFFLDPGAPKVKSLVSKPVLIVPTFTPTWPKSVKTMQQDIQLQSAPLDHLSTVSSPVNW